MTEENRAPDVDRVQPACLTDHKADAEGHACVRDDRAGWRALGAARPVPSARGCARDGDERTRDASHAQKPDAALGGGRLAHAEDGQQWLREKEEEAPDDRRPGEPEA